MRAMILAAGQGKRLRPLTNTIPKPLIEVQGKSLIAWHIEKLRELGITELVVNGAYLKDKLFDYLQDGSRFGVKIAQSSEEADGLETAGGIIKALALLGSEPFLVVNGDIFYAGDYHDVIHCPKSLLESQKYLQSLSKEERLELITGTKACAKELTLAHLYLVKNPAHNLKGDYAVSKYGALEYGHDYTFSGLAWYLPEAFLGRSVKREPLRPYFDAWVEQKRIQASTLSGSWFDVGTIERLQELESYLQNKLQSK